MKFEEKVRSMTFKQILGAMIYGLENRHINVNMDSFGGSTDGLCFGCAATNTVCEISGSVFSCNNIHGRSNRAYFLNSDYCFFQFFEDAIDDLRIGNLYGYNKSASIGDFAKCPDEFSDFVLPPLRNDNWENDLWQYKQFHYSIPDEPLPF